MLLVDFRLPFFVVSDHSVEDHDYLAHAGDDRDHFLFAVGQQPLIELADYRVMSGG